MNGSAVVALLQPAPEVYHMFDDILLLREVSCVTSYERTRPMCPIIIDIDADGRM